MVQLDLERRDLVGVRDHEHTVTVSGAGTGIAGEVIAEHVPGNEHDRAPEDHEPREQRVTRDELEHRHRQRGGSSGSGRREQRGAAIPRLVG